MNTDNLADSLLIAFSSVLGNEKGGDSGTDGKREGESLSCSSEQLFQQIIPSNPDREKDEREQEETGGRRMCFSGLEIIPTFCLLLLISMRGQTGKESLELVVMPKYSTDTGK